MSLRDWMDRIRRQPEYVLVVMRLEEMLRVHPQMDRTHVCSQCQQPVGIYPSGQKVLRAHRRVKIVCHRCSPPTDTYVLAPGAEAEPSQSVWKS